MLFLQACALQEGSIPVYHALAKSVSAVLVFGAEFAHVTEIVLKDAAVMILERRRVNHVMDGGNGSIELALIVATGGPLVLELPNFFTRVIDAVAGTQSQVGNGSGMIEILLYAVEDGQRRAVWTVPLRSGGNGGHHERDRPQRGVW